MSNRLSFNLINLAIIFAVTLLCFAATYSFYLEAEIGPSVAAANENGGTQIIFTIPSLRTFFILSASQALLALFLHRIIQKPTSDVKNHMQIFLLAKWFTIATCFILILGYAAIKLAAWQLS